MVTKIALICNTYIRNYGSILQSLALYDKLLQMGYKVDVIDYKDIPRDLMTKVELTLYIRIPMLFKVSEIKKKMRELKASRNSEYLNIQNQRSEAMDKFVHSHFVFSEHCESVLDVKNLIYDYDCVLIGSDQLWGVAEIIRDYHTLNFVPNYKLKVSYATSFGVEHLPLFVQRRAAKFLKRINALSVREISGARIIKDLVGRNVPVVVDPTLLFSKEEWSEMAGEGRKIENPYIFCFFLGDNPSQREFSIRISKRTKLPIVSMLYLDEYIPSDKNFADINLNDASPADFLNLIKNAEYVICDSFHASVFSILFRKKFYTLDRYSSFSSNSRNTRILSLFSILGVENRHISPSYNIDQVLNISTDYDEVQKKLEFWRQRSLEYLESSLKKI